MKQISVKCHLLMLTWCKGKHSSVYFGNYLFVLQLTDLNSKPYCLKTCNNLFALNCIKSRGEKALLLIKNDFIYDATYATKCLIMSLRQYGNDVYFSSLVPNQNQVFHYIRDINLKRITSLKGSFPRHCARATQLFSKRFCSGGEAFATLCVQFDMPEVWISHLPLQRRARYCSTNWSDSLVSTKQLPRMRTNCKNWQNLTEIHRFFIISNRKLN